MSAHYTYFNWLIPPASEGAESAQKFAFAVLVAALFIFVGKSLTKRLGSSKGIEESIIPAEKPGFFSIWDLFIESFINYHDSILGKENRKHASFSATVFFFLLFGNLLGIIPGMPAMTTTVWVTVSIAFAVFIYFNCCGVKEHGAWGYIKHFMGPVWWLIWFIFPLEIMSTCLRVLTLNLRIYWNIAADHMVLEVFTGLMGAGLSCVFYILAIFVSLMQAFVFATLGMVYILLATEHQENEH